ncbi:MAG: FAD-dependent oxidoreductase [Candidatus Cloacimonetes bacterium]|nr:FAD-dependent oxidoreductase [Candidatus Cloacimonadota bacterium]MDY0230560.1 FAD-dependent oxidoreductase [Candidatus Cloacimonadaceae bacterium]
MKIIIIGGVAGGATTAARLRRVDENAEIIMIERSEHISYANCGLPYYIGGVIQERDNLFVQTPESFSQRTKVDVRVLSEVTSIMPESKTVNVKDLRTGKEYSESYDKLVLSPGAEPVRPNLPGIDTEGIFTMRNVADTDKIKSYIDDKKIKRAIVVGAGFIGLEMAENLHKLGVFVSIVEMAEQVMTPLDYSMASIVHQHLKTKNVAFFLNDGVSSFIKENDQIVATLKSSRKIKADMVILSIGVRADSKLARESGLDIGITGGIVVNEFLQTSDPNIYAVGDAIEFENPIIHKKQITYLAGPANKQGRICADNIAFGNKSVYKGAINTAIAKVFDLTVASTGVSGRTLKKEKIPYLSAITHSGSHAGYYPGSIPMSIKIVFSPKDGKLFGAQIVGYNGVDKRIDLLASIVKFNGTIYDLKEIEHAYAPPFSSAKDPVNIMGFMAENILNGLMKPYSWRDIESIDFSHTMLIDVRTKDEFELGAIRGAINIPTDEIRDRLGEISQQKKIVLYCSVGPRGYIAARILMQLGYSEVFNLIGGYKTYEFAIQKQSNEDVYDNSMIAIDNQIYHVESQSKDPIFSSINMIKIDACGLQCPGPILKLKKSTDLAQPGQIMEVKSTDPAFSADVKAWANVTGNRIVEVKESAGVVTAVIEKQTKAQVANTSSSGTAKNKSIIVFSDDLDKAIATFVIANGAAAMGSKMTIFFTFWGLNVIKKPKPESVSKDFMGKMFGMMMPKNSKKLKLSKMNMWGMGPKMIRMVMKNKKIESLESLMQQAHESGVEFIACTMSMDVMGVKKEELHDYVTYGGVATYLERAEDANVNLFI